MPLTRRKKASDSRCIKACLFISHFMPNLSALARVAINIHCCLHLPPSFFFCARASRDTVSCSNYRQQCLDEETKKSRLLIVICTAIRRSIMYSRDGGRTTQRSIIIRQLIWNTELFDAQKIRMYFALFLCRKNMINITIPLNWVNAIGDPLNVRNAN